MNGSMHHLDELRSRLQKQEDEMRLLKEEAHREVLILRHTMMSVSVCTIEMERCCCRL